MDFRTIFQFRDKKIWWLDVIFYLVMSLLVATILCYLVFIVKNIIQRKQIAAVQEALLTVGTPDQKVQETEVVLYKKKIGDFSHLIENHLFASNTFALLEAQTQPNVWFSQFGLDEKNNQIQLTGEAEDMEAFSRQADVFEKNEYIKNLGSLNSSLGDLGQINFNFNLTLDPKVFSYIINAEHNRKLAEAENIVAVTGSISEVTPTTTEETPEGEAVTTITGEGVAIKSNEKSIFSFTIPLTPEVVGTLDQTNYTISLVLPAGTDITKLAPIIITSDKATVFPQSRVSQDFSNPVTYEVKAEDGTTQNYTVTANVLPEENVTATEAGFPGIVKILLAVALIAFLTIIALIIFLFIKKRKRFLPKRK